MIKNNTYMGHALRIVVGITVLVLLLATSNFSAQGAMNPEAKVIVLSEDSNVNVTFEGSSSSYNNLFGFWSPKYQELFWGHSTSPGTNFDLGYFPSYTELIFFIKSPDGTFLSGPGNRNPDGTVHAAITDIDFQTWRVGFEDLLGGGDRDYNDITVLVKGDLYVIPPNPARPDFIVLPGDISFSNNNPEDGDIIEIQASIRNLGSSVSSNIILGFYDGDPDTGGQPIATWTINGIGKEENVIKTITWDTTGKTGTHNVYVKIDPENLIDEAHEDNNKASQEIIVGNSPTLLPGIITAVSTNPNNPELSREKFGSRLAYVVTLSLYNPNDIAQNYQVGLKNEAVDENDLSKGYFTICIPADSGPNPISITVPAHETGSLGFMCASEWNWIPEETAGYASFLDDWNQMRAEDIVELISTLYKPKWGDTLGSLIDFGEFAVSLIKAGNQTVVLNHEYIVELNSASTPGITFDSGVNQNIVVGVPFIKKFLLVASGINSVASDGASAIGALPVSKASLAINLLLKLTGYISEVNAAVQYQQAWDPDFNYTTIQEPIPMYFPELDAMPDGDAKKFVLVYADIASLRNASFVAYVRADGARIDNQSDYMLMQLEAANNYTVQAMQKMPVAMKYFRLATASMELLTDEQIQEIREEIQTNGLPQDVIDLYTRNGLGYLLENKTQRILNTNPEIYRNPKNYSKLIEAQSVFLAYESKEYTTEIVRIKVEEKGASSTIASEADIAELENLKSQINLSINQGIATSDIKALIDEMIGKSREVLDETNNLAYMPYYEFAVNALAVFPALDTTPPEITSFTPASPVNDIVGATRTFTVNVNQTTNVTWYINETEVFNQSSVTQSSYTNTSAALGTWNVIATAVNENGSGRQTWVWTVTPVPTAGGSISGYKINDTNGNGKWNKGEKGISNWTIRLIGITGKGKNAKVLRKETLTDATGFYKFDNLSAGRYFVIEKLKKGFMPTSSPVKRIKLAQGKNSMNNNFTNRPVHSRDKKDDNRDIDDYEAINRDIDKYKEDTNWD